MSDNNELLELLQADVTAVLTAVPALAIANVIADNEGDIEAKVTKALATFTETGGKNGLAIVVLLPEITEGEKNLPGPPLTAKLEIRCLENVLFNRAAATGSLMRSSQAALTVLSALHLRHLGHCLLAAEKDPVSPVAVKKGHVSHAVTLYVRYSGFITAKPLGVVAAMAGDDLTLTCASAGSTIRYTTDGSYPSPGKTLYTTPITGLEAGDLIRAAAYVSDQAPGDVLEFTITE